MAYQNELYHHGILGMKWGVRRYQNKDGSLTPAGKKRYAKLNSELDKLDPARMSAKKNSITNISEISDQDLNKAIARLRLEKEYKQLVSELQPKKVSNGESIVKKAGKYAVKKLFDTFVETSMKSGKDKKGNNKSKSESKEKTENEKCKEGNERIRLQMERETLKRQKKAQKEEYDAEDRRKKGLPPRGKPGPFDERWLY